MDIKILGMLAEFVGNIIFGVTAWKKQGTFPVVSILVTGLLFAFLGGMFTLMALPLVPTGCSLVIMLAVSSGVVAITFAAQRAGMKLGFLLTPARGIAFAAFVSLGSMGALYLVNAL